MRSILTRAALTIAAGTIAAVPLANAAADATVSALWGPGSVIAQTQRDAAGFNAPGFGSVTRDALPTGCVPHAQPATVIPAAVVVVHLDGSIGRVTLDDADHRTTNNNHADDVWVVGTCAR